ncbi:MAG: polyribonucleotide nucleotidyltransferase [bacterium]
MFKPQQFAMDLAGRKLIVEVGKMAHYANAAVTVRYGDTVVLGTAVMGKEVKTGIDFFPLTVEMMERMYAVGRIKGSRFLKRDGKPSDNAILVGRMIDRGIRPLFNQEIRNEVQVVLTTLAYDEENQMDITAIMAAAMSLHISDIPWNGPLTAICVGRINGELVVNPTISQLAQSDMKLVFSVGRKGVLMVDANANEVTEEVMAEAFAIGMKEAEKVLNFMDEIQKAIGLAKKDEAKLVEAAIPESEVPLADKKTAFEEAKKFFAPQLDKFLFNQPVGTKRERKVVAKVLLEQFVVKMTAEGKHKEIIEYIENNFETYLEAEVTKAILDREQRVDGRKLTDVRTLRGEISLLPRVHGSALFSRGETQVMSIVTLGAPGDVLIMDELTENDTKKRYIHFYNSPPYSFGEVGSFRSVGRREIGHGALAEKALLPVLPTKEDFPYTIVVVSEVMGSNGSSSMASTCCSTLSLMEAGVPIKKPVAGVAMGLASDGARYKILTDLQDFEDGEGGMDFKITGTRDGITAVQMDTKTIGLSFDICAKTLVQSKQARMQILDFMQTIIAEPRKELSQYAPRILTLRIEPEKIRDVIGAGGKIINEIIDNCGVEMDIEDDGLVTITSSNAEGALKAKQWVEKLVKEVAVGEIYDGKVVRLMDFGAFVEILPKKDGLVHISELADRRVDKVSDVINIGDEVRVMVIKIDEQNRINLSIKRANPNYVPSAHDNLSDRPRQHFQPHGDKPRS